MTKVTLIEANKSVELNSNFLLLPGGQEEHGQ